MTTTVRSQVAGKVWTVDTAVGAEVAAGDTLMVLESMKMEIPVEAPAAGRVAEIAVGPEDPVDEGQVLCVIES